MCTSMSVHISSGLGQEHMVVWPRLSSRVSVFLPPSLRISWPDLEPPQLFHYAHVFTVLHIAVLLGFVTGVLRSVISSANGPSKGLMSFSLEEKNPLWCFKRVDVSSSHQAIRWGCGFLQLSGRQQIIWQGKTCALFLQQCVKTAAGLSCASDSQQEGPSSVVPFLLCINYRSTWLQSPNMKENPQVSYQFL